jgi:hypothetical protein
MGDESTIPRYPLEWPAGWMRTPPERRRRAAFTTKRTSDQRLSIYLATERLQGELDRLGAKNQVLSTNVSLRLDGRPRSDEEPRDPGAAVYFRFRNRATVLACDRYDRVADNIAALAAHIDALRRIERYGLRARVSTFVGRWVAWRRRRRDARRRRRLFDGLQVSAQWIAQHRREAHFDRHWEG